jgi:hypothetical protein
MLCSSLLTARSMARRSSRRAEIMSALRELL